jgi:hypothetical protein
MPVAMGQRIATNAEASPVQSQELRSVHAADVAGTARGLRREITDRRTSPAATNGGPAATKGEGRARSPNAPTTRC